MHLEARRAVMALLLCTASAPAMAQTPRGGGDRAAVSASETGLEEIVITARRREESLQQVPLAVTALTPEALKIANVTRMENLGNIAPSLIVAPTNGRTNVPAFAIRGQRQESGFLTNDPSVGIYVAEAVQARVFGLGQSLYDLESVQVLKGPQGTLFGRNSTGGAILFQPRRPVLNEFSGYAQARYGNYDRFDVEGAVNLPLGPTAAARISVNRTRRDGFVTNVSTGKTLNGEHTDGIRGTLLFKPTETLSNTLYADYFRADASGSGSKLTVVNPAGPAQRLFNLQATLDRQNRDLSFYEVEGEGPSLSKGTNLSFTNVTVADLSPNLTLKNIANYRKIRSREGQDLDGTNSPILNVSELERVKQLSEELQLQGKLLDERLTFITGLYYFVEDGFRNIDVSSLGARPNPRKGDAKNTSYSMFAQADYKILDNLTATVGGRYTWDKRFYNQDFRSAATGACLFCGEASKKFSAPTYTLSLSWQIDPTKLLYVANRRGYRAGGFVASPTSAATLQPYEPEYVTDYEIGFKGDWRFGVSQLRTNIAAYHTDYTDVQRLVIISVNNVPVTSIFNAASATIDGFEAEAQFFPIPEVQLSGSLSHVDTEYKKFVSLDSAGRPVDRSANRFAYIPKWTYRIAGRVHLPIGGDTDVFVGADYYLQSSVFFSEFNTPLAKQGAYGLTSGRLDLQDIGDSNVDFSLWVKNLGGKRYYTSAGEQFSGLGAVYQQFGEPRTYGIEVSTQF